MNFEEIRNCFRNVFEDKWKPDELDHYEEMREKFAFHMADIFQSVTSLADLYRQEEPFDLARWEKALVLFFNHAMPHLVAAANIYDEIPSIFEEQKGVHAWKEFQDGEVPMLNRADAG